MTKRRDFIKKSVFGATAATAVSMGIIGKTDAEVPDIMPQPDKDWHTDPEWRKVKYGDWGGPGVSAGPGPMDRILLKDYAPRSLVVTKETFVSKAKYPAIDSHVHVVGKTPAEIAEWVQTMDEVGMETSMVLTRAIGGKFEALSESLEKEYPGRFYLYCGMVLDGIDKPDYPKRAVAELERCYRNGAKGVGEVSDKGYGITGDASLPSAKRLHPDDERLDESVLSHRGGQFCQRVRIEGCPGLHRIGCDSRHRYLSQASDWLLGHRDQSF